MIRDSVIDWQELSALYEHADALDEPELAAWLAQLRREQHRLIPQLERMLDARAHISSGTFLEALPRIGVVERPPESEWVQGSLIGAYRLLRHLGSGGMAEVWLAERADGAFERQVAIKLPFNHPGRAQRQSFVERFRRERDIVASLHHPNIASLHDAGVTSGGQPWLALEFVEGEPITAWCDENRMSVGDRVKVFLDVLRAVEHAHANLVIHRDLKPANILVTREGAVRLLDFGIAKLLGNDAASPLESELTRQSGRPLTPQYASPEQLLGKSLTTATDIYSLGVVLYELLGGDRPYQLRHQSLAELERSILDDEPRSLGRRQFSEAVLVARGTNARALSKALATDLDAIVTKSLAKLPSRRYSSVEALRADLQRWQADEPVEAKRPSLAYVTRRFLARHRLAVSSAAIGVAALVSITVVAVVSEVNAREESRRAVAAKTFLLDMFREVDPENSKGAEVTALELLQAGKKRAVEALGAQPALQADLLAQIGKMQQAIGQYKLADATLAQVVQIHARAGVQRSQLLAEVDLAHNALLLGDVARAASVLDSVRARARPFESDSSLQANLNFVAGLVSISAGDSAAALTLLEHALKQASDAYGIHDALCVTILRATAEAESELGRYERALGVIDDAAERATRNYAVGPRDRFGIDYERARVAVLAGKYAGSADKLAELSSRCDLLLGERNEDCEMLLVLQSIVLLRSGERAYALELLPRLMREGGNDLSPRRALASLQSALRVAAANGLLPAKPDIRERLARIAEGENQSIDDRSFAFAAIAESFLFEANAPASEAWARKALAIQSTSTLKPSQNSRARAQMLLGIAIQRQGRTAEALSVLRESRKAYIEALGPEHPLLSLYALNEVASLIQAGERARAQGIIDTALPTIEVAFGRSSRVVQRARELRSVTLPSHDGSPSRSSSIDFFS
jgi:serine/threonine protein kinase